MANKEGQNIASKSIYEVVTQPQLSEALEEFPAVRGGRVVRAVRWVFSRDGRAARSARGNNGNGALEAPTAPAGAQPAVSSQEKKARAEEAKQRSISRGMND